MAEFDKPMPVKTPVSAPFWDALAEHKIRIQYSPSSEEYVFYPRILAPRTLADDLEWREISGAGTLYTFTIAIDGNRLDDHGGPQTGVPPVPHAIVAGTRRRTGRG